MKIITPDFSTGQVLARGEAPEVLEEIITTPAGFAEAVLRLRLYPWQDEVLAWFEDPRRRTLGALALWWIAVHPRGRVVITTKDAKQLDQQLLPALERHRGTFPGWKLVTSPYVEISTPSGARLVAFTTNDAGRAEGWHKEDDTAGPLLVIVDEAKSVEERIFRAIDRCTFNALLYVSSPGLMLGTFYDAFTKSAALFRRRKVSLEECPHIPREKIEGIIAKYGADHPFTRSSVHGEFMNQDATSAFVFPLEVVQSAVRAQPVSAARDYSAFCDFAAGGDENVLAIRRGASIEIAAAWREPNTQASLHRFVQEFKKAGLAAHEIFADEGGLGRPMVDSLWALGWEVNRVNFASTPHDPIYENRGAEMWYETAASMARGEVRIPADDLLLSQLTTRKCKVTGIGKLGLESKGDVRNRGGASPDRADALCGAWACRAWQQRRRSVIDEWREEHAAEGEPGGFDAG